MNPSTIQDSKIKLKQKILKLKRDAGSHSPSIFTFKQKLPELKIKVDACFLSNPYATDLFLDYFNNEILSTGKIRDLLEFYPSQNDVIAETLEHLLGITKDHIFIGNGAIEIIQAIIHDIKGGKVVIPIPTFSSYYEFVHQNVETVFYKLNKDKDYILDVEDYIHFIKKEKPTAAVLINPNNPNGAFLTVAEITHILDELTELNTVILDESFIHFAYENENFEPVTVSKFIDNYKNLVIVKSMSKDFGIAGLRAGYGVMHPDRVKKLLSNGFLWNSNGLAEYFFNLYTRADFLEDYEKVRIRYIKETQSFIDDLREIKDLRVYPSKANFVLLELPPHYDSDDFVAEMLVEYGIYLRTGSDKIGLEGQFIRLASRTKQENNYILDSFKNYFQCRNDK